MERSEAQRRAESNLRPWKPGQSGNPGGRPEWRRALDRVVGDGAHLFQWLAWVAEGRPVPVLDAEGRQIGERRPTLEQQARVAQDLLDRAFGKAAQVQVVVGAEAQPLVLPAVSAEEAEVLRRVAQRRALGAGTELASPAATVPDQAGPLALEPGTDPASTSK